MVAGHDLKFIEFISYCDTFSKLTKYNKPRFASYLDPADAVFYLSNGFGCYMWNLSITLPQFPSVGTIASIHRNYDYEILNTIFLESCQYLHPRLSFHSPSPR